MCKCNPNIRTPYCGIGNCVWPTNKEGVRKSTSEELVEHTFHKANKKKRDERLGTTICSHGTPTDELCIMCSPESFL